MGERRVDGAASWQSEDGKSTHDTQTGQSRLLPLSSTSTSPEKGGKRASQGGAARHRKSAMTGSFPAWEGVLNMSWYPPSQVVSMGASREQVPSPAPGVNMWAKSSGAGLGVC